MSDLLTLLDESRNLLAAAARDRIAAVVALLSPSDKALIEAEIRGALATYSAELVLLLGSEEPGGEEPAGAVGGAPVLPVSTGMDIQEDGDLVRLRRNGRTGANQDSPPSH